MKFDPATLRFGADGLIPAIAQDVDTGEVLMFAWMNAESVAQTLATGRVTYWSRSRAESQACRQERSHPVNVSGVATALVVSHH